MSGAEKAGNASEKRSLAKFLVGNSELEELSARLNQFNILQVLRIERAEIRHSNVLGWLLNPRESHGLSDTFVRRFISTLLLENELEQCKVRARSLWLIPKKWATVMPKEIEDWESPYPVAVWFYLDQRVQKLGIILEIGPLPNSERCRRLVDSFRQAGFTIPARADKEGARYSRFYSRTRVIEEIGDSNEVRQAMEELWKQSKGEVERATKVIKDFVWDD
jgi:hypothetical protein